MVTCGVLVEVRTDLLYTTVQTRSGFERLMYKNQLKLCTMAFYFILLSFLLLRTPLIVFQLDGTPVLKVNDQVANEVTP
jgi:hypothetical protein